MKKSVERIYLKCIKYAHVHTSLSLPDSLITEAGWRRQAAVCGFREEGSSRERQGGVQR
jgi:hypothetical protein